MMLGNKKAALYLEAVHRIYLKYLHGSGCLPSCSCWREWRFRGQFKSTLYEKFRAEIDPIYKDIFGEAKEGNERTF